LARPDIGEEFHVELERGKVLILKLLAVGPLSEAKGQREVFYEMNGEVRQVTVDDVHAAVEDVKRVKADPNDSAQVGAPMSGVVIEIRVHNGADVKKGDPIAILSAMKMVSLSLYEGVSVADVGCRRWSFRRAIPARSASWPSRRAIRSTRRTWCARLSSDSRLPRSTVRDSSYKFMSFRDTIRSPACSARQHPTSP
jgi:biotin carboxyl carrier protein